MIDTQVKRASVLGVVQPDSTIDQGDRQTVLEVYAGILVRSPEVVRIVALSVEPYIAQTLTAVDRIAQTVTAGELISQTVTWEDSEL